MTTTLMAFRSALASAEHQLGREAVLQRVLPALDAIRPSRNERYQGRAPFDAVEWRDASQTGDGSYLFTGHAATVNTTYTLMDLGWLKVTESTAQNAFDHVLSSSPDVHFNLNHNMERVMARTGVQGIGSLTLSMDARGLATQARIDPEDPDVQALAIKMKRGLIDQMSYAFAIGDETRTEVDDGETVTVHYTIDEVAALYDVCACAQGANPMTDSSLRALESVLGHPSLEVEATGASGVIRSEDHRGTEDVVDTPQRVSGSQETKRRRERDIARTLYPRTT